MAIQNCQAQFSKDELKKAVEDLAFEIYHFRCYIRLYPISAPVISQAIRYSLLLHLRVLLNFFSGTPRNDDCCAVHFRVFPGVDVAFNSGRLKPPKDAQVVCENLNKRLAHFTATRWRKTAPAMKFYEKYFSDVETLVEVFQAALPDDVRQVLTKKLSEWAAAHPVAFNRC